MAKAIIKTTHELLRRRVKETTWKGGLRLLDLADFLQYDERVKGHFDMSTVLGERSSASAFGVQGLVKGSRSPDLGACGSVACAMGWAPMVPSIRAAGLRYRRGVVIDFTLPEDRRWGLALYDNPTTFISAACAVFEIRRDDANLLFYSHPGHRTPFQVARNLRAFVHDNLVYWS